MGGGREGGEEFCGTTGYKPFKTSPPQIKMPEQYPRAGLGESHYSAYDVDEDDTCTDGRSLVSAHDGSAPT